MTKKNDNNKNNSAARKLIPAIGMLTVSAMMLSSSTYAWFSMNKDVTVTGLQLTAKSNSTYLLIGSDDDGNDTLAEIQATTNKTTACTIAAADSQVYPSAHEAIANTTAASTVGNWYFKVADLPTASTSTGSSTALTADNFGDYVLHKTVYVTLASGAQAATNLVVSDMTITSNNTASGNQTTIAPVKVLVTSADAAVELDSTTRSSNTALAANVTNAAVVPLDIWLYYNGNDAAVFTNNIANLDGANVTLQFSVTYNSDLT
jgi:hypothetical protein